MGWVWARIYGKFFDFVCVLVFSFLMNIYDSRFILFQERDARNACMRMRRHMCLLCVRLRARCMCVHHSLAASRAYGFPLMERGLRTSPNSPHCARPAAASPGAPMGGAPTPNVELPLVRG